MIIGIDSRAAAEERGGRGRYVRELLGALAARDDPHRYRLYARSRWEAELDERFSWELLGAPDPLWHLLAARGANRDCDVFLSTNSYLTVWFLRIPAVPVICDLIPFIPEARARKRSQVIERLTFGRGVARAAALDCISEATRRDLVAHAPAAAKKAFVVPLGVSPQIEQPTGEAEVRERYALPGGFVLTAGVLEPRKNLVRLVRAHATLPDDLRRRFPLVIAGPAGWENRELEAELARAAGDVRQVGFVPDRDLAALYGLCSVFAYVSLYEGFGLPLLEAMAAGAACLTSDVSSLPEVGGDAVAYADPRSPDSIGAGLAHLLEEPDERTRLGAAAKERAAGFSWARTAEKTVALLERVQASTRS